MTKPQIHDLPPKYQAQVIEQLHATPRPKTVRMEVAPMMQGKKRIRQNSAGPNKTEQAFLDYLKRIYVIEPAGEIMLQKITLQIANGCRYTPDFIVKLDAEVQEGEADGVTLYAYEVKGFMRDDAAVKLKVAASLYPWIKFHLVSKGKGGTWNVQEVLA